MIRVVKKGFLVAISDPEPKQIYERLDTDELCKKIIRHNITNFVICGYVFNGTEIEKLQNVLAKKNAHGSFINNHIDITNPYSPYKKKIKKREQKIKISRYELMDLE